MAEVKDLAGKRFYKLLVIKRANAPENDKSGRAFWLCQCDCGKEKIISSHYLLNKETKSCGCHRTKWKSKDFSGKKINHLLILKEVKNPKKTKNHGRYYLCKCDCGEEKVIRIDGIISGKVVSCGCYGKEQRRTAGDGRRRADACDHVFAVLELEEGARVRLQCKGDFEADVDRGDA